MTRSRGPLYWPQARRRLRADARLQDLIREYGPPSYKRTRNAFASLVRSIISQQVSAAAARTIHRRFLDLFGGRVPAPSRVLETPLPRIRTAGLSAAKTRYILDLAAHFADGRLSGPRLLAWDDSDVERALLRVKGLGPWSVHMFQMFALERPDILPVGDLGVRKGMQAHFELDELPDAGAMRELAQIWSPYRSAGSWYMWRLSEAQAARRLDEDRPAKGARRAEARRVPRPRRNG